jgi:type II secretory pathway pseudopilin PulG
MDATTANDEGTSLIEATIALAVCAAVLAATLPALVALVRSSAAVRARSMTAVLAASKLDQLRALEWFVSTDAAGSAREVIDTTTDLSAAAPARGGPGLLMGGLSTLRTNVAGYADFLDADGRWLAAGEVAPLGTRYVRRWAVAPLPLPADGVVALHAVVFAWRPTGRTSPPLEPEAALAWLTSAKAREWR